MMKGKSAAIGLIGACVCALCVGLYVMGVDQSAAQARAEALERYGGDQLEAVVARRNVGAGEMLAASDVELRMWPADLLPEGAVLAEGDAVGQRTNVPLVEGEVVCERRLGVETYAVEVPEGLVAVSVPAREVQTVGGALASGMRADVYATGSKTALLLESVLVIATSSDGEAGSSSASWVTLAVKPEKVQEVVTAAQNLELYFTLPGGDPPQPEEGEEAGDSGKQDE